MSIISILPEELSNRIAAGEVVERPASVVKELFENAVDAGASVITVEIERAGSRLIRISDNGCGMDAADAVMCFSSHATSKIKNADDIERITTLGFRGEALPSIASVSRLSLKTRTADSPAGTEVEVEGGKLLDQRPAGMPVGTIFSVRDLFFNVPARKKFLRSPATEEAHIQEMVIALALGFPQVDVTLKFDNKIALQAIGNSDPAIRAAGLFGKSFAGKMLKVDHTSEDIHITGLIAAPGFSRTSRREQRTFVNGRAVESQALYRGIREGYGTLAEFGRFPPTMLNIELDAAEYDINVHPSKREVRFKREYAVSRAVTNALTATLRRAPAPEIQLPPDKKLARPEVLLEAASINYAPAPEIPVIPGLAPKSASIPAGPEKKEAALSTIPEIADKAIPANKVDFPAEKHRIPSSETPENIQSAPAEVPIENKQVEESVFSSPRKVSYTDIKFSPPALSKAEFTDYDDNCLIAESPAVRVEPPPAAINPLARDLADTENIRYVGILFDTFVAVEFVSTEQLYLIDFHAAHERVLYEDLLNRSRRQESVMSQQLLLPPTIELSRTAAAFINKNEKFFQQLGFDVALLSSNTALLNAVPSQLPGDADWEAVLTDLVNSVLEGEKQSRDSLEAIARAACHSAVKANDPLNEISARALLKSLSSCQRPDVCPHGRPTVLKISKNELSRRFGRI